MPPTHAKKPAAMREKCAHGGPMHCNAGCYSKGGVATETSSSNRRHSKGVHESITRGDAGTSVAGAYVPGHGYGSNLETAKQLHREKLGEMRADKTDRRNLAEGGDVEPLDEPMQDDGHEELESVLAEELLSAMEKKDKKGVVDAIEALVLQCMNKGGM